jgi:hypothetical protein
MQTLEETLEILGHNLKLTVEYSFYQATPDRYDERTGSVILGDNDRVEVEDVLLDGHSIRSALRKNKCVWRDLHEKALTDHMKRIL